MTVDNLIKKVDNRIAILEDRMKDCDRSIKND
jgi:hypothetical protein